MHTPTTMSTNPADVYAENTRREQEANPIKIDLLDDNVLACKLLFHDIALTVLSFVELPDKMEVVSIIPFRASAWCKTCRVNARLKDGEIRPYFMKASLPLCSLILQSLIIYGFSTNLVSLVDV